MNRVSSSRIPPTRRGAAGFTLIEIIVAFGILALGLTLLLGTLSGATRQVRQAGDAGRAAMHAHSLLAEYSSTLRAPARFDGELEDGRYRWQLQATPWQDPGRAGAARSDPGAPRLLHVQLDIEWADGGPQERLQVASLRLALPPQGSAP
ncbi:MAG: general secretion pathway protein GspI [Comamonadaceae bacterium]|nr:MAG: general secretion pathway protein GspI [Comamonadaceae bacterium]